jgi:hypothetical protein
MSIHVSESSVRIPVQVRVSSATWAAPAVLALLVLYYEKQKATPLPSLHGYAPALISHGFESHYALAYGAAAALASWESGRLKQDGVWASAPVRSQARIAVTVLLPVWLLAWFTMLLPAGVTLAQARALPSLSSLPLVVMPLVVGIAYSVLGFAAGLVVSRVVAAPVLAAGVWYAVAASWSFSDPMWIRHVLGQYPTTLMFGELPTWTSLFAHILFVGSAALAVGLFALVRGPWPARLLGAVAVVLTGTLSAYSIVADWKTTPTLVEGHAPISCAGHEPHVCMPHVTAGKSARIQATYQSVTRAFAAAHVPVRAPETISDSILDGRYPRSSTATDWYLPLSDTANPETLRFQFAELATMPRCGSPDRAAEQQLALWTGAVAGARTAALAREQEEAFTPEQQNSLEQAARTVLDIEKKPPAAQGAWYTATIQEACAGQRTTNSMAVGS